MRPFNKTGRGLALVVLLPALAGCSEYVDRRETISIMGGNAVESNKVVQMVDPWPRESGDRNIAHNGAVMQAAVERYRTGRVIPPNGTGTSSAYQAQQNNSQNNTTPVGPTVTQPAAPVK